MPTVRGLTEAQWLHLRNWTSQLYIAHQFNTPLAQTFKACWFACHTNYVESTRYDAVPQD